MKKNVRGLVSILILAILALSFVLPLVSISASAESITSEDSSNKIFVLPLTFINVAPLIDTIRAELLVVAVVIFAFVLIDLYIIGLAGPPVFFVWLTSLARALSVISVVLRAEKNFKEYNIDLNEWSGTKSLFSKGVKYRGLCLIP